MNSLLSSNFGQLYTKVGTQFTEFGWPNYEVSELLTTQQVRGHFKDGGILGGHLCSGIESIIGGNWDVWMNARRPLKRLSSGIMRFHSASFKIPPGEYSSKQAKALAEERLLALLSGPLIHETNGVAKRLAGFAVANTIRLDSDSDLEKASCFEMHASDQELCRLALNQLNRVQIVILPEYLHASLITIEKKYSLPPIMNLFSNLKHNPASLGNSNKDEQALFEFAKPMLRKMSRVDHELWRFISEKFQKQIELSRIERREILVREVLHRQVLISPRLVDSSDSVNALIENIVQALYQLALQHAELGEDIIKQACRWNRFSAAASVEIQSQALHRFLKA